jgi:hypothetical protein
MKTLLKRSSLSAAIALTLVACGGGGGGLAGIGGSGFISSGSITGFGSVIVNGVKFETNDATFDVDGMSGTQDDLAIGMIVNVNGSINADGISGTATSISFDDELQGPVSVLSAPDLDGITRTFTVLDVKVIIDSGSTTFDISGENNVPPSTIFNFDTIADNNNVEISGFFNSAGDLLATRVELKDINFDVNSIVEVKGKISALDQTKTSFNLGSLKVETSQTTIIDDSLNGLADGKLVEVKGTFDIATNTISATKIEAEDDSVDDADEFELEGLITDYVDDSNFMVGGIPVDASNVTLENREPTTLTLKNDLRVEVEGAIVNGTLIATEIKLEDGNIKVHANIGTIDVPGNSFTLIPVSDQPVITVTVTTGTQFEDDVSASPSPTFNISDLVAGTFVEVEGHENDSIDGFTATEVEVTETDDIIVQGNLQGFVADTTIQILGVTFDVDFSGGAGETEFENSLDQTITQGDFDSLTSPGDLVKIKDKNDGSGVLGTADEIEIETP